MSRIAVRSREGDGRWDERGTKRSEREREKRMCASV